MSKHSMQRFVEISALRGTFEKVYSWQTSWNGKVSIVGSHNVFVRLDNFSFPNQLAGKMGGHWFSEKPTDHRKTGRFSTNESRQQLLLIIALNCDLDVDYTRFDVHGQVTSQLLTVPMNSSFAYMDFSVVGRYGIMMLR